MTSLKTDLHCQQTLEEVAEFTQAQLQVTQCRAHLHPQVAQPQAHRKDHCTVRLCQGRGQASAVPSNEK